MRCQVILGTSLTLAATAAAEVRVVVTGAAPLTVADARTMALDEAFAKAVTKLLAERLSPGARQQHQATLDREIIGRARLWVQSFRIEQDTSDASQRRLTVGVALNDNKLEARLDELAIPWTRPLAETPPVPVASPAEATAVALQVTGQPAAWSGDAQRLILACLQGQQLTVAASPELPQLVVTYEAGATLPVRGTGVYGRALELAFRMLAPGGEPRVASTTLLAHGALATLDDPRHVLGDVQHACAQYVPALRRQALPAQPRPAAQEVVVSRQLSWQHVQALLRALSSPQAKARVGAVSAAASTLHTPLSAAEAERTLRAWVPVVPVGGPPLAVHVTRVAGQLHVAVSE